MRKKLIELLKKTPIAEINGHIAEAKVCFGSHVFASMADHLIANGVTIPVRCKDCRFWEEFESSLIGKVMCCTGQGSARIQKLPEDFCSYGERRTDDETD